LFLIPPPILGGARLAGPFGALNVELPRNLEAVWPWCRV